jgi:hypothetical protein
MSLHEFRAIISSATHEQRQNLAELTGSAFGSNPDTLCNHIRYLRSGTFGQIFDDKSWKQLVTDVADHIGIDWLGTLNGRTWEDLPTSDIETAVVAKGFQDIFDNLSPEQKEQVVLEIERNGDAPNLAGMLMTGGAMALARASGFGVYLTYGN